MKARLILRLICVTALLHCLSAKGDTYKVGDSFVGFHTTDQHGTSFTFKPGDAKFVLFDTPGESGQSESPNDPDWFAKHQALLIVNLADLSIFKRRIGRSRLESKPFRALVLESKDDAEKFPKQEGKFTVLRVDDAGKITSIQYAAPGKQLQDLVTGSKS